MIRHIIWDFDGTLFNTYPAIVYSFVSVMESDFAVQCDSEEIGRLLMVDTKHCALVMSQRYGLDPDVILHNVREFYDTQTTIPEEPHDYAKDICELIRLRGSNALVTHRDKESTVKMLTRFDMLGLFSQIITSEDGFAQKPAPDSFLHVLQSASLADDETLAVGDRDLDIQAAMKAGVHSVFFSPDGKKHPNAEFSIRTLAEIKELQLD